MLKIVLMMALCLLQACSRSDSAVPVAARPVETVTLGNHVEPAGGGQGRTSDKPSTDELVPDERANVLQGTYWPAAKLDAGEASISCDYDYAKQGDGTAITSLAFFSLVDALSECQAAGVVRLRYKGPINAGFAELMQRVSAMATRMEIRTRILDINSTGGHVEQAIRAGDAMADANWDIWVRERSICHSACVLILAAGDTRSIAGKVGIHRLIRDRSNATSRAELNDELKATSAQVHEYLGRNGVATAVADLMMTIANRDLRLLTNDELKQYGLAGTNAAQDDLDRIKAGRKCGADFVRRKDAFGDAFNRQCLAPGKAFETADDCGLALREQYGFPDRRCPDESPLADVGRQPAREATGHQPGRDVRAGADLAVKASPASVPPSRQ